MPNLALCGVQRETIKKLYNLINETIKYTCFPLNSISEAATGIMGAMSSRLAYITGSNNIRPTQEE